MSRKDEKNDQSNTHASAKFGFGGILEGIQKFLEAAANLKDSSEVSRSGEFTVPGLGEKQKGIFGFSIRTLAGGENQGVTVRPFGNIHKTQEGLSVEEDTEPAVDVLEEGNRIRVIAELPGACEDEIDYELAGDVLTISAKGKRRYYTEVLLPHAVQNDRIESSYNNGVLELRLTKTPSP